MRDYLIKIFNKFGYLFNLEFGKLFVQFNIWYMINLIFVFV